MMAWMKQSSTSGYVVNPATKHHDIFGMQQITIHSAVLSESFGSLKLREVAENVWRQWPMARILLLREKQTVLEDPLYDEAADREIDGVSLLGMLAKLSISALVQQGESFPGYGRFRYGDNFADYRETIDAVECDAIKMPGYGTEEKLYHQDLPGDERQRRWPV